VLPPSVARVGAHYGDLQAAIVADALGLMDQALRRGKSSPDAWRDAVQSIGNRLLTLQVQSATYADAYLNDILKAQGASDASEGRVNPQAWADLTDGGGSWLQGLVHARPAVKSYVRMLRGTSCARCAILAGRHYKSVVAFQRHKRCDCVNIPAAESGADWSTDPKEYFESLDSSDQDRLFTKAGAEAIRRGADMNQVVNVRQGITVAESFGQKVAATTVGTTSRGLAGQRLAGTGMPRLLPDEIFLQAERLGWDRAEVLTQLKRFAYIV
jgi:hypothetical protein